MRAIPIKDRARLVDAAMQRIPCDLTIKNVQVVNTITGEIYPAEVDILDGIITRVRLEEDKTVMPSIDTFDGGGAYLMPGFIDIHMHVESTMLTPEEFGKTAILRGTTSVFVDPHEIGNVLGIPGVQFMLDNAKRSPVRQFNLAPSCVPAVPGLEGSGAVFGPEDISKILDLDGVAGIAEVMDFIGVYNNAPRMRDIVDEGLRRGVHIQGHATRVVDKELAAYALGGPTNNHSARTTRESTENLRNGIHLNLQNSSLGAGNLPGMLEGFKNHRYTDNVSLCTDDVHAKDLLASGHVNRLMRQVISLGAHVLDAIRWCTYNPAREAGMEDLGGIAPGFAADLQLVEELDGRDPKSVFVGGKLMCKDGKLIDEKASAPIEFFNTVHIDYITGAEDFELSVPSSNVKTAVVQCNKETGVVLPEVIYEELPVNDSLVDIFLDPELCYVTVCNRHGAKDKTTAVFRNLGILSGAIASTISHDSHNLTIAYRNSNDAYIAAKHLRECGGGMCAVLDGKVLATLPLPVAGLMSMLPCAELVKQIDLLEDAVGIVCESRSMMMRIAIISLTATPTIRITDKGLVDGAKQVFLDIFKK